MVVFTLLGLSILLQTVRPAGPAGESVQRNLSFPAAGEASQMLFSFFCGSSMQKRSSGVF